MTDWAEHAIWWHLHPLTFLAGRTLRGLEPWLDYARDLGCNGLALGPIFESRTHGYDTTDYFRIDPRLGDRADFDWLVEACHSRGMRLLLDGVFNHVGRDFAPFQDVLAHGQDSAYVDWFHLDFSDGLSYVDFEGDHDLVALNHESPAVRELVTDVVTHWLRAGADGWRLDVAYNVPLDFWAALRANVRPQFPDAWFLGEVLHGDYSLWIKTGGLDSVTQYELWKAIWSSLNDRNFFELSWAFERHDQFMAEFSPLTFVGNHDVTRLASALTDERHLAHALVMLLTVGGVPSIYAGDEQAFRGVKYVGVGGDDAIRPAFPERPDGLAPDGWPTYRLHQELIGLRRRHPWLYRARTQVLDLQNEFIRYRSVYGDDSMTVLLNVSERAREFDPGAEVLAGRGAVAGRLEPHGWAILAG